ncbi:MAG: hypothetical protein JW847_00750 [Candidatus Omnitrophica bacterium]|nr:hypothetical protein [Candidatus Omnitrophota bacterium]
MIILLVLVILLFLGGIILLSAKSSLEMKPREQFLQELSNFLQGTLEPMESDSNEKSYRIKFRYKEQDFVYEDLENQGFKDKVYKAYLKAKTPSKLMLTFAEKEHSTRIRTEIFIASEVSTNNMDEHVQLRVPKYLKDLKIVTNDSAAANKLLEDPKTASVFKRYKNVDNRGYFFLTISIVNGEIVLEFRSIKSCHPNVFDLRSDIHSIDNHLERMIALIRKLKEEL